MSKAIQVSIPPTSQGNSSGGEAIGTIVSRLTDSFYPASEAQKYLFCDGSTFDKDKYPILFAVLGSQILPDLRNRFLEGNDIGGQIIKAGLPNIVGELHRIAHGYDWSYSNGAFSMTVDPIRGAGLGSGNLQNYTFDAEQGRKAWEEQIYGTAPTDAIYGNSTTVQPPAITVRYYIRAK